MASIENNEQSNEIDNDIIQEPHMDISEEDIEEEPKNEELFTIERRRKILILQFYLNEFAHKLTVYKDMNLEGLSGEELVKIKNEFDFIIGTTLNDNALEVANNSINNNNDGNNNNSNIINDFSDL